MNRRSRKIIKISTIVFLSVMVLLVAGTLYLNYRLPEIIKTEFSEQTSGAYALEFDGLRINILNRSAKISNVRISPAVTAGTDTLSVQNFSVRRFSVTGIRFSDDNGRITLKTRDIRVTAPSASIKSYEKSDSAENPSDRTVEESLKEKISSLEVGSLVIENGNITYSSISERDTSEVTIHGIQIDLQGFKFPSQIVDGSREVNSAGLHTRQSAEIDDPAATGKILFSDFIRLEVSSIEKTSSYTKKTLRVDSLFISTADSVIRFAGLTSTPRYDKAEYAYRNERHADWTELKVARTEIYSVDFNELINRNTFAADSVRCDSLYISSFKNRKIDRQEWIKPMFHTQIQDLGVKLNIRTASVGGAKAIYEELAEGGYEPGRVWFDIHQVDVQNINTASPEDGDKLAIITRSMLMGRGDLQATFHMPLHADDNYFEVSAVLGPMDLTTFTPIATNLAGAEVRKGSLQSLNIYIGGTSAQANSRMTMEYRDLEAAVLRDKDPHASQRTLVSALANLIIRSDNPDRRGRLRQTDETVRRDELRSPFNYLWQGVWESVKQTVIE